MQHLFKWTLRFAPYYAPKESMITFTCKEFSIGKMLANSKKLYNTNINNRNRIEAHT
jgi:hypothetical protein